MAEKKFDLETFSDNIVQFLKDDLNAKLTEIDAEKADGIILTQVDDAAYFFQTLDESSVNLNPFVFYGVDDSVAEGNGPAVSQAVSLVFWIVLEDSNQDLQIARRMLRYLRAMTDVFTDNFDKSRRAGIVSVTTFVPVQFKKGINSTHPARVAAVEVLGNFA